MTSPLSGLPTCLYGADGVMSCGVVEQPPPFAFQIVAYDDAARDGGCTRARGTTQSETTR